MNRAAPLLLIATIAMAGDSNPAWRTPWKASVASLAISTTADAATSFGGRERNPLLAGSSGSVSTPKLVGAKSLSTGALVLIESRYLRAHPKARKAFTILNFGLAGVLGGVAIRNSRVGR